MLQLKLLSCLICIHGLIQAVYGADKYTDENRPYEFGFTIDGEQHRHEKKDENGIIMGEFGFITADGVYHVTVYATDKEGRFKILSMKNIRVKPYPTAAVTNSNSGGVKKGHSIPFPPSENAPVLQGPSSTKTLSPQEESKPLQINKQIASPARSCSSCSIPTTTTKAPPPQLTDIAIVSKDRPIPDTSRPTAFNNQQNTPLSSSNAQSGFGQQQTNIGKGLSRPYSGDQTDTASPSFDQNNQNYAQDNSQRNTFGSVQGNYQQQDFSGNSPPSASNYPQQNYIEKQNIPQTNQYYPQNEANAIQNSPQLGNDVPQNYPNKNNDDRYYTQEEGNVSYNNPQIDADQNYPRQQANNAQSGVPSAQPNHNLQTPKDTSRNPKQYDVSTSNTGIGPLQGFGAMLASQDNTPISNRPTLLAAQMQIVPKDTDIYHRNPGEEEGLPDGISKDDMTHLLYTFNYTVGFHGHQEEGYSNGAKKGYYYVTGRNGIRTRIDYIADERGFRPKISQEVLDLLSDDVPKPETEKDEKFGLKGYEFKWLYYPTDA